MQQGLVTKYRGTFISSIAIQTTEVICQMHTV